MNNTILSASYLRLIVAVVLVILGAYLFITDPSDRVVAQSLLIAGGVGHLLFLVTYIINKRKSAN